MELQRSKHQWTRLVNWVNRDLRTRQIMGKGNTPSTCSKVDNSGGTSCNVVATSGFKTIDIQENPITPMEPRSNKVNGNENAEAHRV